MIRPVHLALLLSACLWLAGCATTIPTDYERTTTTAFPDPGGTELGRFLQTEMDANPGKSGTVLLSTGEWGFRARAGLANQAGQTIDVQYYIWEVDTAGIILAEWQECYIASVSTRGVAALDPAKSSCREEV